MESHLELKNWKKVHLDQKNTTIQQGQNKAADLSQQIDF